MNRMTRILFAVTGIATATVAAHHLFKMPVVAVTADYKYVLKNDDMPPPVPVEITTMEISTYPPVQVDTASGRTIDAQAGEEVEMNEDISDLTDEAVEAPEQTLETDQQSATDDKGDQSPVPDFGDDHAGNLTR